MTEKRRRLPDWLIKKYTPGEEIRRVKVLLRGAGLHTVCESARCPNLGECFSRSTATFMILGNTCTRSCGFCAVPKGEPAPPDPGEPRRVARVSKRLGLKHVVITSVSRDDLPDGGASHFAAVVVAVKEELPGATVEILTPDFAGNEESIRRVADSGPDVFNHNLETVSHLYGRVRPQADYGRSLALLGRVKKTRSGIKTKSGLMVGLGETQEQVWRVMEDLRAVGCDLLTIGQYLQPTRHSLPVVEYIEPDCFVEYRRAGLALGFEEVLAEPLARSSYHAEKIF